MESAVDKERAEFEKWANTLRWDLKLAPASLYPRQPPRYDVTLVQSGWLSWQACAASLRAKLAERDAEVGRLKTALLTHAVEMSYDYPGDSPEECGMWCNLCQQHVEDNKVDGHAVTCLLHNAALSDQPQHQGEAKAKP